MKIEKSTHPSQEVATQALPRKPIPWRSHLEDPRYVVIPTIGITQGPSGAGRMAGNLEWRIRPHHRTR